MKRSRFLVLILTILALVPCFMNRSVEAKAFNCSARGMCVIEASSHRVLYERNKDAKLPMASTTKVVTALTVLNNCTDLDQVITVDDKAVGVSGTSIYLRYGEQLSVRDLLYGLMLRSGNDAATALAIHVGGSVENFAKMMTQTAVDCGAVNSHFANPHGLDDPEHYTTAYDLALITTKALENPVFSKIVSTVNYQIKETEQSQIRFLHNKNRLLNSLDGCIGVKTGFTNKAGRCLVSATERDGMKVVCVVLNCGPMFEESTQLLNSAYNDYSMQTIVPANTHLANKTFMDVKNNMLYVYCKENIAYPVRAGENLDFDVQYRYLKIKPQNDSEIGIVDVFCEKHLIKSAKLYTINSIELLQKKDILDSFTRNWVD